MTNTARLRKKRTWKKSITRFAIWNIISWSGRNHEILTVLNDFKIDFCAISKTKKKGKGTVCIEDYILAYLGKAKEERVHAGVGLLIHKKYMNNIDSIEYINERIIQVTLTFPKAKWCLLSLYAPDISKTKEQREELYKDLQNVIAQIPKDALLIMMGDMNARIGNIPVQGVKQRFNESEMSENGDLLTNFCSMNSLRINNTFFKHKWNHKITWSDSRGRHLMIDYIITNRNIHPSQIFDVRAFRTADNGSDHRLVISKFRVSAQQTKKPKPSLISTFNVEAFQNESTRYLYEKRLSEKLKTITPTSVDSPDLQWEKIQECIVKSAEETLGMHTVDTNALKKLTLWFTPEIKELAHGKRKAYLKYISKPSIKKRTEYREVQNRVNLRIREIKEGYWENLTADMEHYIYGVQKKVWKLI